MTCADPSYRHPKRAHAPIAYFPLYAQVFHRRRESRDNRRVARTL